VSNSYAGYFAFAGYIYGTGRNWKGPIGKMTINVNHGDDVRILGIGFGNDASSLV
jgi:hypothetical protein